MNDQTDIMDLLIQCYDEGADPSVYLDAKTFCDLISNDSEEVRLWFAKALVNCDAAEYATSLLCKLAQDQESCVRLGAVDSLAAFASQESFDVLCIATNDSDELIRAYAAFGIAAVGKTVSPEKAVHILCNMQETEQSQQVFVDIYEGLYLLGKKDALQRLLNLFNSTDYHVQCAVLHALEEIINHDNLSIIKQFADSLDASGYARAVADAIHRMKAKCQ